MKLHLHGSFDVWLGQMSLRWTWCILGTGRGRISRHYVPSDESWVYPSKRRI